MITELTLKTFIGIASSLSGLPSTGGVPNLRQGVDGCVLMAEWERKAITPAECKEIMRAEHGGKRTTYAYYNAITNAIVLPADFDMKSPFDRSILVHELTHFLQKKNGIRPGKCAKDMEYVAYKAQQKYLKAQGQALKPLSLTDADIDKRTRCGK